MAASGALTAWVREIVGGTPLPDAARRGRRVRTGRPRPARPAVLRGRAHPRRRSARARHGDRADLTHTRGDLYRAVLEATAFGVRHNVEAMLEAGVDVRRVVAVGGGTQGGLWTQIVSDVTGLEQVLPSQTIGAAYGAAFLAAGLVGSPDIDRWNPPAGTSVPDPAVSGAVRPAVRAVPAALPRHPGAHPRARRARSSRRLTAAEPRRTLTEIDYSIAGIDPPGLKQSITQSLAPITKEWTMKFPTTARAAAAGVAVLALALTGCTKAPEEGAAADAGTYPTEDIRLIIQADPGGGSDLSSRALATELETSSASTSSRRTCRARPARSRWSTSRDQPADGTVIGFSPVEISMLNTTQDAERPAGELHLHRPDHARPRRHHGRQRTRRTRPSPTWSMRPPPAR